MQIVACTYYLELPRSPAAVRNELHWPKLELVFRFPLQVHRHIQFNAYLYLASSYYENMQLKHAGETIVNS